MKVAFEPKQGLVLAQISTPKEASPLDSLHLPEHTKRDLELKKEGITFIIRAANKFDTYKAGDEVYVSGNPKEMVKINFDSTEGLQEFILFPEDFIIGKKVSIQEEEYIPLVTNSTATISKINTVL